MNILFLTISHFYDISKRGIYTDLIRKFHGQGDNVFIVTPIERRYRKKTSLESKENVSILKVKILNIQKSNVIEKGLSTILIEHQFLRAIKKYFVNVCFDLVLYSTPPITFSKAIRYIKNKDGAKSYLLLKDIFPQNAVDLEMIRKGGLLHWFFRQKEKHLYSISDHIGCMSPANVEFIRINNPQINPAILEVNPNSIEPVNTYIDQELKITLRQKYRIPVNATVLIYGGNLGKPQGIDFLFETIKYQSENSGIFFIIAGSGTEYSRVKLWFNLHQPRNALVLSELSKNEFDILLQICDIGMIFLDRRFTIPNFPSRLLSYMEFKLPVIAATDKNTDLGYIILENEFGLWSESGDIISINNNIIRLSKDSLLRIKLGQNGYDYLLKNYTVENTYNTIISHFNN